MADVLEVRCPDCGARLQVDAQTGMVLHHSAGARNPKGVNLDQAQEQLRRQEQERERRFQQSVASEKQRDDLLSRKFDQSLRRVKENPNEPRPLRDVDLD
ncbi:MAG: hypothetical protein ACTHJX_07560 [Terriglobales bacterium]|jgi:uncharacterized protein involved in exopolysaccharide biosynthesis